ncbi:NADH dehydrogenase [ubiquinone] 1 alpha subcomplex assembly factor 1 [Flavobacterium sp. PL11]|jgi:NADH dehydrogenase [ubiquinone] 1 alpha subcomplex assembly factor 1|uniref:CIA30 family protein n=1 Tax=Flavobacterium sp. PL11 TaxID=3071717 RepID=UPI002DFCBCDF|nr:NADH dehydrogenase [ubiquinone] 1 alpha subcomplex assembly factor 1 [Flavobacterium sp. PL11]
MNDLILFEFNSNSDLSNWQVVNDGVMGGKSKSQFYLNDKGEGLFEGKISLENNGGFCSVRFVCDPISIPDSTFFSIRLKGDGKQYQFRVKSKKNDAQSYVYPFQTSGEWETIKIPVEALYPAFRGQKLTMPNYNGARLEEIAFLIGNNEAESFKLLIGTIEVQ